MPRMASIQMGCRGRVSPMTLLFNLAINCKVVSVLCKGEGKPLFEAKVSPSSLRWQCPRPLRSPALSKRQLGGNPLVTPVVVANTLLHFIFFKVCRFEPPSVAGFLSTCSKEVALIGRTKSVILPCTDSWLFHR